MKDKSSNGGYYCGHKYRDKRRMNKIRRRVLRSLVQTRPLGNNEKTHAYNYLRNTKPRSFGLLLLTLNEDS